MSKVIYTDRFGKPRETLKLVFKRPERKPEPWHNIVPDPDSAA